MTYYLKSSMSFVINMFTNDTKNQLNSNAISEICSKINPEKKVQIVQFGIGDGSLTKEILKRLSQDSILYSFGANRANCAYVKRNIDDKRLMVIYDEPSNFRRYVSDQVDNFINTFPFTFFKKQNKLNLLQSCFSQLKGNGVYSHIVFNDKEFVKQINGRIFEKKHVKSLYNEIVFHIKN